MKKLLGILCAVVMVFVFAMPAFAAVWVGGELGPAFTGNTNVNLSSNYGSATVNSAVIKTSALGGLIIGYDFVNQGALAYGWPDWMKYFSVAVDLSYQGLNFGNQIRTVQVNGYRHAGQFAVNMPSADGSITALSFLFMGKLPLLIGTDYPAGRLFPYVAVGSGVMFNNLDATNYGAGNVSSTNVGLVTEAGVRYMVTPAFSVDMAFRYSYESPTFNINGMKANMNVNNYNVLGRVAYHW